MASHRVAVLGLGYVGLPLVRACVAAGHDVVGFDVDEATVSSLAAGRSHVGDVSDDELQDWLSRSFAPTASVDDLSNADVFVICVPTPLSADGGPDLAFVESAAGTIARVLRPGCLVVLESTTYPGTTEEVVRPILERGGLVAGADFALAFSPERIDPGNRSYTLESTPKVVGGLTPECARAASAFYSGFVASVVVARGLREAEMTKLLENTYRHVNIALVNEMARFCNELGIDIWNVIDCAGTKPFGFESFRPGPGVGGHCIPIDPSYLSHRVRSELGYAFRFVELAEEINAAMPDYVVERVQRILAADGLPMAGARILVLGVTYKRDIADLRQTPASPVVAGLRRLGALVSFHDPYVAQWAVDAVPVPRVADVAQGSASADCVILLQDHAEYVEHPERIRAARLFDTRGALRDHSPAGGSEGAGVEAPSSSMVRWCL